MTRPVSAMLVIGMERNILANRSIETSSLEVILVRLLAKTNRDMVRVDSRTPPLVSSAAIPKQLSLTNQKTMCSSS